MLCKYARFHGWIYDPNAPASVPAAAPKKKVTYSIQQSDAMYAESVYNVNMDFDDIPKIEDFYIDIKHKRMELPTDDSGYSKPYVLRYHYTKKYYGADLVAQSGWGYPNRKYMGLVLVALILPWLIPIINAIGNHPIYYYEPLCTDFAAYKSQVLAGNDEMTRPGRRYFWVYSWVHPWVISAYKIAIPRVTFIMFGLWLISFGNTMPSRYIIGASSLFLAPAFMLQGYYMDVLTMRDGIEGVCFHAIVLFFICGVLFKLPTEFMELVRRNATPVGDRYVPIRLTLIFLLFSIVKITTFDISMCTTCVEIKLLVVTIYDYFVNWYITNVWDSWLYKFVMWVLKFF